jgi:3-oxoacyl-[acyl-carrier-protein] synthase-3
MSSGGCAITGWGTALPPTVVTNEDLKAVFDTTDEWIYERSGIRSRYVATGPFVTDTPAVEARGLGTTATLAVQAGRRALDSAGVTPQDVDTLILCTSTPDLAIPATSSAVAGALGITSGAMDLNAACAGFTYGLITAAALMSAGAGPVLLIGSETMSRVTNWDDRTSAFLFGDGAGAVLLEPVEGPGALLGWHLGVDGSLVDLLYAELGSGMVMRGREVFRKAVRATADSAKTALDRAQVGAAEIDLFVPHQANQRIMDAVGERLGIPQERIASVIEWTGNTSSASIPLALVDAVERGRLRAGDLVLLSGFGAGMTFASAIWRWGTEPGDYQ